MLSSLPGAASPAHHRADENNHHDHFAEVAQVSAEDEHPASEEDTNHGDEQGSFAGEGINELVESGIPGQIVSACESRHRCAEQSDENDDRENGRPAFKEPQRKMCIHN